MTEIRRGLKDVVFTETRLSRVDGESGRLWIGGFPVEELAPNARFEETLFLLLHDRLPDPAELEAVRSELAAQRGLPTVTHRVLRETARRKLDPMDALRIGVATLGVAQPELLETAHLKESAERATARALRLIAVLPSLAAATHRLGSGAEVVEPDPKLDHAANYLWMLTGCAPDASHVRALETYLNTTVDHGMNASTFAARVIVSTRSDLCSALEGALGALKGPLHGGAPGPALDTVFSLRDAASRSGRALEVVTEDWVRQTVSTGGRVMGFGHRVYRVRDPRADVLGSALEEMFPSAADNPLYADARRVERVVLRVLAELKPNRRLETNVEFYTALLLHGLGLPPCTFTPTFAVARVAGWMAHALEQISEDRLIRPRVAYAGELDRHWVAPASRSRGDSLLDPTTSLLEGSTGPLA